MGARTAAGARARDSCGLRCDARRAAHAAEERSCAPDGAGTHVRVRVCVWEGGGAVPRAALCVFQRRVTFVCAYRCTANTYLIDYLCDAPVAAAPEALAAAAAAAEGDGAMMDED